MTGRAFDKQPMVFDMSKKEEDAVKELKKAYEDRMKAEGKKAMPCRHTSVDYHIERGYILCKLCGRIFGWDEYQEIKKKINEELGRR